MSSVRELVLAAHVSEEAADGVISRLRASSFLGIEEKDGVYDYAEAGLVSKVTEVLARKLTERRAEEARLSVHPAYRANLEIAGE
jgi:hypothetical protein